MLSSMGALTVDQYAALDKESRQKYLTIRDAVSHYQYSVDMLKQEYAKAVASKLPQSTLDDIQVRLEGAMYQVKLAQSRLDAITPQTLKTASTDAVPKPTVKTANITGSSSAAGTKKEDSTMTYILIGGAVVVAGLIIFQPWKK